MGQGPWGQGTGPLDGLCPADPALLLQQYHAGSIENIREATESFASNPLFYRPVAIALDTKGPEIRTGLVKAVSMARSAAKRGAGVCPALLQKVSLEGSGSWAWGQWVLGVGEHCQKAWEGDCEGLVHRGLGCGEQSWSSWIREGQAVMEPQSHPCCCRARTWRWS